MLSSDNDHALLPQLDADLLPWRGARVAKKPQLGATDVTPCDLKPPTRILHGGYPKGGTFIAKHQVLGAEDDLRRILAATMHAKAG